MTVISNCAILLVITAAALMSSSEAKRQKPQKLTRIWYPGEPHVGNNDVNFYLFTKKNPNEPIHFAPHSRASKNVPNLNPGLKFKFLIHDFAGNARDDWIMKAKDEYLKKGDYNVVTVDWSKHAIYDFFYTFTKAAKATKPVGKRVAKVIIAIMKTHHIKSKDFHLIGHSLGAHAMGSAGKYFYRKTKQRIGRITGTDPAGPFFGDAVIKHGKYTLTSSDAEFVDVIHTDGTKFGYYDALGHVDFYPNGGIGTQPGCYLKKGFFDWIGDWTRKTTQCSHDRAHDLFVESINTKKFVGRECKDYVSYKEGHCLRDNHKTAIMGENVKLKSRGVYYLQTNCNSPYARNDRIKVHTC